MSFYVLAKFIVVLCICRNALASGGLRAPDPLPGLHHEPRWGTPSPIPSDRALAPKVPPQTPPMYTDTKRQHSAR